MMIYNPTRAVMTKESQPNTVEANSCNCFSHLAASSKSKILESAVRVRHRSLAFPGLLATKRERACPGRRIPVHSLMTLPPPAASWMASWMLQIANHNDKRGHTNYVTIVQVRTSVILNVLEEILKEILATVLNMCTSRFALLAHAN